MNILDNNNKLGPLGNFLNRVKYFQGPNYGANQTPNQMPGRGLTNQYGQFVNPYDGIAALGLAAADKIDNYKKNDGWYKGSLIGVINGMSDKQAFEQMPSLNWTPNQSVTDSLTAGPDNSSIIGSSDLATIGSSDSMGGGAPLQTSKSDEEYTNGEDEEPNKTYSLIANTMASTTGPQVNPIVTQNQANNIYQGPQSTQMPKQSGVLGGIFGKLRR